jgi:hypothetical protein
MILFPVRTYLSVTPEVSVNFVREQKEKLPLLTYLLRGLSPQANYTDRATAACRRS